jgi:hypothetical protein
MAERGVEEEVIAKMADTSVNTLLKNHSLNGAPI